MEWIIPAFAFPAKAGTHLPTPEGWKAESTLKLFLEAVLAFILHQTKYTTQDKNMQREAQKPKIWAQRNKDWFSYIFKERAMKQIRILLYSSQCLTVLDKFFISGIYI